jgi:flagellar FliL protein
MISIVVIANNQRAESLKMRFQPLVKAQISIFGDYEQGLKAVFDKRPAAVFIQKEIDSVSGEAVAKQIKGLLRDGSPRLILMGDHSIKPKGPMGSYDDSFNFMAPDDELFGLFKSQLDKIPLLFWKEKQGNPPMEIPADTSMDALQEPSVVSLSDPSADPGISVYTPTTHRDDDAIEEPDQEGSRDKSALRVDFISEKMAETERPSLEKKPTESLQPPTQVWGGGQSPRARTAAAAMQPSRQASGASANGRTLQPPADDLPPFDSIFIQSSESRSRAWLYGAGLLVALAIGGGVYYYGRPSAPPPRPAAVQAPKPAPAPQALQPMTTGIAIISALPLSIPVNGRDAAYSGGHPGWERYIGNGLEYLVFGANGALRAVQVLATKDGVIDEPFVARFLQELLGHGSYTVASASEMKGYLVQHAQLGGGAELAVYRKKPGGQLRGFVVTVP